MNAILLFAAVAELFWADASGTVSSEIRPLEQCGDTAVLRVSAAEIVAKKSSRLEIFPDFAFARKGESGYWFSPYGYYGEWDCDDGEFVAEGERMNMPMYGWSTPRGAWLAIVTSLPYYGSEIVRAKDGVYKIGYQLGSELCEAPYEDLEVVFHSRSAGTSYAALAKMYRDYQLGRGAVRPLAERAKENPALKYAVECPEVRIRQAWKPVPSPEPYQTPDTEPPVRPVVTFDRVDDIIRSLKSNGVDRAELCLVGWNIGGHDGRWPQAFPAEPKLGGTEKLRETIAFARKSGYLIVPHGNFIEGYTIADIWNDEIAAKERDGVTRHLAGTMCWGGGQPISICPRRAYEIVCSKTMPEMADCGFRGLGYFDVVSILRANLCFDPRHPCNWKEGAAWWGRCAELSKRLFGGFASEGAVDHFAGSLDSVLYASFDAPADIERKWREGRGLAKGHRPIFQLVYNGIMVSNPFTFTVNFTAQDKYAQLKLLEYGGRPNFYFYSKFMSDPKKDWMGKDDLRCATDEQLEWSVGKIREGAEIYARLAHLQYEFMTDHEEVSEGVYRTSWANGDCLVVDYLRGEWKLEKGTSLAAALCASASAEPEACRPAARFTTAPWWTSRLAATRSAILKEKNACYDLVLVGDSITHRWENKANGAEVYPKLKEKFKLLNLGNGGDKTQNVIWRFENNGELDDYTAKVFAVMIGVNNGDAEPEGTIAGVKKIVGMIREKHPESKILLQAILPHGKNPLNAVSAKVINPALKAYAEASGLAWLDMSEKFLGENGELKPGLMMPDNLHPIKEGYEIWLEELAPVVERLLGGSLDSLRHKKMSGWATAK